MGRGQVRCGGVSSMAGRPRPCFQPDFFTQASRLGVRGRVAACCPAGVGGARTAFYPELLLAPSRTLGTVLPIPAKGWDPLEFRWLDMQKFVPDLRAPRAAAATVAFPSFLNPELSSP